MGNLNAEQYTTLCNLIEYLWMNRRKREYYDCPTIDDVKDLGAVSSQSRAVVNLIQEILWDGKDAGNV